MALSDRRHRKPVEPRTWQGGRGWARPGHVDVVVVGVVVKVGDHLEEIRGGRGRGRRHERLRRGGGGGDERGRDHDGGEAVGRGRRRGRGRHGPPRGLGGRDESHLPEPRLHPARRGARRRRAADVHRFGAAAWRGLGVASSFFFCLTIHAKTLRDADGQTNSEASWAVCGRRWAHG